MAGRGGLAVSDGVTLGFTEAQLKTAAASVLKAGVVVALRRGPHGGLVVRCELVGTMAHEVFVGEELLTPGMKLVDLWAIVKPCLHPAVLA